jgi:periplasmic protein TonB
MAINLSRNFLYCHMKNFLILCLILGSCTALAQDKNSFFALDAKMNQTVLDSSKYILWIHETDSTRWQWDYFYTWGSLVKSTRYADHDGTISDGRFCRYNSTGDIDSTGIFDHGKKNGSFFKFKTFPKDSIVTVWQYDYVEDSLVKSIDLFAERQKNQTVDSTKEKESEYPGGMSQWQQYLVKNMRFPERAQKKEIQGQVQIIFKVDKDGNITDPYVRKSVEYSLDQESLRLIIQSGKWDPATKEAVPVNSYKIQPLNYKLEGQ